MPQLGETVTEGTITRWMKAVGEEVARDEPLFEVSTDKVDSEVPSPAAGVLSEILVPEGETVEVGVKLAVIGDGAGSVNGDAPPAAVAAEAPPAVTEAAPPRAATDGHAGRARTRGGTGAHAGTTARSSPGLGAASPGPDAGARARRQWGRAVAALAHGAQASLRERHQRLRGHGDRPRRAHHRARTS